MARGVHWIGGSLQKESTMFGKIPGIAYLHAAYRRLTRKRVLRALSQRAPRPAILVETKPAWKTYRLRNAHLA
jgi:hypothetical protein